MAPLPRFAVAACRTGLTLTRAVNRRGVISSATPSCNRMQQFSTRPLQQSNRNPNLRQPLFSIHVPSRFFHTTRVALSSPKFTYGIAASFTAKDHHYNPDTNVFSFNPYNRIRARRKDKRTRPDSGQDAFFVSRIGDSADVALGVVDGVGGWVDSGVDPADFAHGICDYMAHAAYTHKPEEQSPTLSARSLMQRGFEDICRDDTVLAGGSTACVAVARGDGSLEVANLGDSGFVQLRLNAIRSYSEPQTHAFNTPFQLSIIPEKVMAQAAAFGGEQLCDFPKDADISQHQLRHGDVLVFASDGVWDNLSSQDMLKMVSKVMLDAKAWEHTRAGVSVGKTLRDFITTDDGDAGPEDVPNLQSYLAAGITAEAKAASLNTRVDGPFAREVQKYYPHENWRGGKVDDICVVVAIVCEEGK
ncbi:5-azacytidine resistance protein azr [Marssonina coronariae]|uniref:Protein phosphatase n=1 Tax=Diplocarpon coronariae TaxID=2795749 RepID=A0A218YZF0_9HELO|nr:5-azacytidine resistance protein azr [Marssonina coronariae]